MSCYNTQYYLYYVLCCKDMSFFLDYKINCANCAI